MHISLSLLFLFIGSTSAEKLGDFGILTACITKNKSLRFKHPVYSLTTHRVLTFIALIWLDCYYANCSNSPPFECEFMLSNGSQITSNEMCRLTLPNHPRLYANTTMSYNCTLTRRKRREEKQITIDYSIRKGKQHIKLCLNTTGLLLHRAPTLLWPVVILSLWRVLATDSQTT